MNNTNAGFWKEFRDFALKGNVVELSIAVVVGAAFGKITSSVVNDLVMPLVNPLLPGGDWRALVVGPGVRVGSFIGSLIDFLVIALTLFIAIRALARTQSKKQEQNSH